MFSELLKSLVTTPNIFDPLYTYSYISHKPPYMYLMASPPCMRTVTTGSLFPPLVPIVCHCALSTQHCPG